MQQRRLRLGDILDDYCPRERRITNHAVVAMIEDEVKQTRCTTCNADHDYRQGKLPLTRRKKRDEPLPGIASESADDPALAAAAAPFPVVTSDEESPASAPFDDPGDSVMADEPDAEGDGTGANDDEGPVHRRLIRATLPRPEGQMPERKAPDFTVRQPGGRFDQQRGGQGQRGRPVRHAQNPGGGGPPTRGGPRHGAGQGTGHGQRQGNRFGNVSGQRGGGSPGGGRGQRPNGGQGRKRGR
jgi:hypothetical protein